MIPATISKSQFKPKALEYLRMIEETKRPLVLTHAGKPVIKITPYEQQPDQTLKELMGTVISFDSPIEPVGLEDWKVLK